MSAAGTSSPDDNRQFFFITSPKRQRLSPMVNVLEAARSNTLQRDLGGEEKRLMLLLPHHHSWHVSEPLDCAGT